MSCLINDDKVYLSIDIEESTRKCRRKEVFEFSNQNFATNKISFPDNNKTTNLCNCISKNNAVLSFWIVNYFCTFLYTKRNKIFICIYFLFQ